MTQCTKCNSAPKVKGRSWCIGCTRTDNLSRYKRNKDSTKGDAHRLAAIDYLKDSNAYFRH